MYLQIDPAQNLSGNVTIPPNKSQSFRALIMAGLAEGTSRIIAPAISNDWMLAAEALEMFGATIEPHAGEVWEIQGTAGNLKTPEDVINCGNSGIILRFFCALAACCKGYTVLTGDESLRRIRPMAPLIDAINGLGAWAVCTKSDGHAPVVVRGCMGGGTVELDGADSQPVSSLLIAASLAKAPTELIVHNSGEKPWISVTLDWLDKLAVEYSNENFRKYRIRGGHRWSGFEYRVPLDWSAALYPVVAAIVTPKSEVHIAGMNFEDPQGDKAVLDVLRKMGADIQITDGVIIARSSKLKGQIIDCNDFIDQLPLLAVVATAAEGETTLTNAAICRTKECDRIKATHESLASMGAEISETPDGLVIRRSHLRATVLDSHNDHRMVMAMAVAGLIADGRVTIRDIDCIKKTFAHFPEQMARIGAEVQKV